MSKIHSFKERLSYSEQPDDEKFWCEIYKQAFPNMVSSMLCSSNSIEAPFSQRMGIDRVLLLSNGRVIRIDEKKRASVYPDILLEYVSNSKTGSRGWMDKDLFIDYLAYAFMPTLSVYMFDWLTLRRVWRIYRNSWIKQYKTIKAKNPNYETLSVAVPTDILLEAYNQQMVTKVVLPIAK